MIKKHQLDIANSRREYVKNGLRRKDLTNEPLVLFERWLKQAYDAKLSDPTAMCVATVDKYRQPYQRIVLLKHYDNDGLVFYTNLASRKAKHIDNNNKVSLLFSWPQLERQVCFIGEAKKLSPLEVMNYFYSRPKDSQIVSWVSHQSSKISARSILYNKFIEFKQKFKNCKIPLPSFWGGYRVKFNSVEFWQGGTNRLHDRFFYQWQEDHWKIDRLAP